MLILMCIFKKNLNNMTLDIPTSNHNHKNINFKITIKT